MKQVARRAWRDAERRLGVQAQIVKAVSLKPNLDTGALTGQSPPLDVIAVPRRLTKDERDIAATSTVPQSMKGWSVRADQLQVQDDLVPLAAQDILVCPDKRYEVLRAELDGIGIRWRLATRVMHG